MQSVAKVVKHMQNQLSSDKGQQPPTQMPNPNIQG